MSYASIGLHNLIEYVYRYTIARMARKTKTVKRTAATWKPLKLYDHQAAVVEAYKAGKRRFFLGWHRRAGKDVFALDFARERMMERVGSYWHLFPYHIQARRAVWKGIDARTGERFIDRAFPKHMREKENDTEMSFQLPNGATWQMLGSDNYDRLIGSNPCGIIFSEWALCDPAAWDYIRPILIENKGWAMFITTFRGRNHAWRLYNQIKDSDDWYADIRTIDDTYRHDGSPIVRKEDVEREIAEGMDPALVQQEFYCNPDAASTGAIFSRQYNRLMWLQPRGFTPNNRVLRVAWGYKDEGIAAVAFQDNHIVGVHQFLESNPTDAVQAVMRRHPHMPIIHHAVDPDPTLFSALDGAGVVPAPLPDDEHMRHGHAAAILNTCEVTSMAREALADFTMAYAPFRDEVDDDTHLTHDALCIALAVTHTAQPLFNAGPLKPQDYSRYDRGVI